MTLDFDPTVSFSLLLSLAAMSLTWFRTRNQGVDTKLSDHGARIASLEQAAQASPGKGDIHRLELHLAEMNGRLAEMGAVMDGNGRIMERLEKIVSRHEDHLLDGGKR